MKLGKSSMALEILLECDKLTKEKNSNIKYYIGLIYLFNGKYRRSIDYLSQAANFDTLVKKYKIKLVNIIQLCFKAIAYEKLIQEHGKTPESPKNISADNSFISTTPFDEKLREYTERLKEEYIDILQLDHSCTLALINLGIIEAEANNITTAFQLINKAKSFSHNNYKIYLNLGNCHLIEQNLEKAIECFKEAVRLNPNNLKILKVYLLAQSKLENWEEIQKVCHMILKLNKSDSIALGLLVRSMKEREQIKPLNKLLKKIKNKLDILEKSGNIMNSKGNMRKNILNLKKKILAKVVETKRMSFLMIKYDDENYELNTKIENTNVKLPKEVEGFDNLVKDPKEYLKVLRFDKNNKEALFNIGMAYYLRQDYMNAEENFLKLISFNPGFKLDCAYEKLGDIHFKRYKNVEKALNYYQISIRIYPNPIVYVKLGRCYEQLGNFENAINEYKNSIQLDSSFVWGMFHLGCLYSKFNKSEALFYLNKAFEMSSDDTEIIAKYCDELIKSEESDKIDKAVEILEKARKDFMGNVEILVSLAKGYEKKNNLKTAINILQEANGYSDFYSSQNRLFILGLFYEKNKNYLKAIEIYKNILTLNKEHIDSLLHLGFILINSREYKRAFKYFLYALKINPNLSHIHYGLGRIYHHQKNYEEAIDHFLQCVSNDYNNYRAFFRMGFIYLELSNLNKAKEMFEKALEIKPNYTLGKVGLGNVYYEEGEFEKSEMVFRETFQMNKQNFQVAVGYGNSLAALQKFRESIKIYNEALKIDENIPELHYSIANSYYLVDKYQEAIFHYVKAIKLDKNFRSEIFLNLGNALSANLKYGEAIKCFKRFLKLDSSNAEAYFNLGNCYYINKNYKKAIASYEEYMNRNNSDKEVKLAMCRVLYEYDQEKCKEFLEKVFKEDPNNTKFLLYYGLVLDKLNDKNQATIVYRKILQIEPYNKDAKICLELIEK